MKEFMLSPQFKEYRQALLKEIADFVSDRLFGPKEDLEDIRGALMLGRLLLRLPLKIRRDPAIKEMTYEDLKTFQANFVRRSLEQSIVKETK